MTPDRPQLWPAGHMAETGGGFHGIGKILLLEPEGHVDEADEDRHLHQGPDDRGKGLAGVYPEDGHGHGDELGHQREAGSHAGGHGQAIAWRSGSGTAIQRRRVCRPGR